MQIELKYSDEDVALYVQDTLLDRSYVKIEDDSDLLPGQFEEWIGETESGNLVFGLRVEPAIDDTYFNNIGVE